MDSSSSTPEREFLDELRRRRAELRESMSALEHALAAPATGGQARWAEHVHVALVELSADFREHVVITEGADGLYAEIATSAPRLSGAASRLTREHVVIRDQVDEMLSQFGGSEVGDDVESVRDRGTALLGTLIRHRQRGSDLVYEAYAVDIGGET